MEFLHKPWPWYVVGPIIGLTVPALLLFGNKRLGISSSLRHLCAACYPANLPLLRYDWKKEIWNFYFVAGIIGGGFIGGVVLANPDAVDLSPKTITQLQQLGISDISGVLPIELFNWNNLFSAQGFLLSVVGGFMVGFGTRYARGCTSGHGIFGLSSLQWPSLLAIAAFFIGGIICSYFLLPAILTL